MTVTAIAIVAGLLLNMRDSRSQPLSGDVVIESQDRSLDTSGNNTRIDTVREVIRPDGSRSTRMIRTFPSKQNPTGWETEDSVRIFDAKQNVTYELEPALKMYGSLPLGAQKFKPIVSMPNCLGAVPQNYLAGAVERGTKFGKATERYTYEV